MNKSAVLALALCMCSAVAEAVLAGGGVKARFRELRLPRYSLPLWCWFVVGGLYYVMIFTVAYRLFMQPGGTPRRTGAIALLLMMVSVNAAWNFSFFRAKNLFVSLAAWLPYSLVCIALFVSLAPRDRTSAIGVFVYCLYLIYALVWNYQVWRLNPARGHPTLSD